MPPGEDSNQMTIQTPGEPVTGWVPSPRLSHWAEGLKLRSPRKLTKLLPNIAQMDCSGETPGRHNTF